MDNTKFSLPEHTPGNQVWSSIEQQLSNDSLIKSLKQHQPNDTAWNFIEENLEEPSLSKRLPNYVPSDRVWDDIVEAQSGATKLNYFFWLKIAASVIIVSGLSYLLKFTDINQTSSPELVYTEVWVNPIQDEAWGLETDGNIQELLKNKEMENPVLLQSKEYLELRKEFTELMRSKETILKEVSPFNDSKELELILTKIELKKNAIVRNLISLSHV